MSEASLRDAMIRLATEPQFAARLADDPAGVATECGLSAAELATLTALRVSEDADAPARLGDRISKSGLFVGGALSSLIVGPDIVGPDHTGLLCDGKPVDGLLCDGKPVIGLLCDGKSLAGIQCNDLPPTGLLCDGKSLAGLQCNDLPPAGLLCDGKPVIGLLCDGKSLAGIQCNELPPAGLLCDGKPVLDPGTGPAVS